MNKNKLFHTSEQDELFDLIRAFPFATLVTEGGGAVNADHLPLFLREADQRLVLEGHLVAHSDVAQADGQPVLAVFHGPQTYVSPGWYPSKQEHGKVVPTWNYAVVHVRGRLQVRRDGDWLMRHLSSLTDQQEAGRSAPWAVSDAPAPFLQRQFRGIFGIEIDIEQVEGVVKMSQNKNTADHSGVLAGLEAQGDWEVADLVRKKGAR